MDIDVDYEKQVPAGILNGIKFSVLSETDAEKLSVISIETPASVTDPRLGFPNPSSQCATCGATNTKYCEGHFGVINFPYTILHPYFISEVVQILNGICPGCKSVRRERRAKSAKNKARIDQLKPCRYCAARAPYVRFRLSTTDLFKKTAIIAELNERTHNKYQLHDYWDFLPQDVQVPVDESTSSTKRVLSPAQVHALLKDVDKSFIKEFVSEIDVLFMNCFPVTPNCHRVTEIVHPQSCGQKIIFDDRSRAFRRLVDFRGTANELGSRVLDCLKLSKLRLEKATTNGTENNNECPLNTSASKWMKEVILTKRSDHIIRSVVTGDPNLRVWEIGIPCCIAERLQISEHLNPWNREKLSASCNLRFLEKGDVYVRRKGELIRVCRMEDFQLGDLIRRPLNDGDVMLVNRPPSIHQHSILALYVKILPINTVVSINPLCCAPLRGDFDGDCLHAFVPQSVEARVELKELVGLDRQLRNGQSGKNLLSLTHDSLTAAHLIMLEGNFLSRTQMEQLEMLSSRQLLSSAISDTASRGLTLWTGKQFFSLLLPSDFDYVSPSNEVHIIKGELLEAPEGSSWLRGDADGNLFEGLINHCGGKALEYVDIAQRVLCEWLSSRGLSVSLQDLYLCSDGHTHKNLIDEVSCGLEEAEKNCHLKQLLMESFTSYLTGTQDEDENIKSLEVEKLCYEKQKSAALSRASADAFKFVFRDIQNLTHQYAVKDNSFLAMIKSGSKGNLMKIVQQSMCLGLQHSLVPLSFRHPHRLSCTAWNDMKKQNGTSEGDFGFAKSFIPFAVVESSFVSGLNPLESFVHSVTSRSSSFSENAEVPGTLTRKLTFFMRDILLAYDGTVRSAYGNQVIQFDYAMEKDRIVPHDKSKVSSDDSMNECNAVGGHPVGALAACAISEAAYSALDQPISILEPSPLLNFKKTLESGSRKRTGRKTVSLFLADKLRRVRYGFEYGALEVKNHLEKLLFSDTVSKVLILYSPQTSNRLNVCPWVCHFHVSKDILKRRRLKVISIIDALTKECEANPSLSNVQIARKNGCLADTESENNAALCITATISQSSRNSCHDLKTIRDVIIPSLLAALVKGFIEVDKVDISWRDQPKDSRAAKHLAGGELYLSVSLSPSGGSKNPWNQLMDACLPIMGLIDWSRSYPDDLSEIFSAYGVDAAWNSFLRNLKSVVSDIGKTVLPEHLNLVADCLSVAGEFVGLSAKGIAKQKAHVSVSSPFMLACFTNAGASFIKAAKRGATDGLHGSLDSLAWGNVPRVGTGAPFEFLYSRKTHEIEKPLDVYKLLASQESVPESDVKIDVPPNGEKLVSEMFRTQLLQKQFPKGLKSIGLPKALLQSQISVDDILNLGRLCNKLLHKYAIGERLSDNDKTGVLMVLKFHPHKEKKIGDGAVDIKVGEHSEHKGSRCFILERQDGSFEDFSYKKCIHGALEVIAPHRANIYQTRWLRNGTKH
ncbi:DNA-directed RNA polymerase IV subunit 1-like [Silene latifolia]|uniref:DNA-directed RNA polymerase IV subunit 1-like n=1 Tax=Silene latifolia TaxID=37657 RepID=UPI003D7754DA